MSRPDPKEKVLRSFELIDHTADVGLRAQADSLAELLTAAAEGMFHILVEADAVEEREELLVELEADDAGELVHTWLRELLFHFDVENILLRRFDVQEATPTRLRAVCHGETLDPERHEGQVEIKAVTYHQFHVHQTPDGWTTEVLFDI